MALSSLIRRGGPRSAPPPPAPDSVHAALQQLFDVGDRLLASRRDAIEMTKAFEDQRRKVAEELVLYRSSLVAAGFSAAAADCLVPSWPSLTAGSAYLARERYGEMAFIGATRDQERAERNWKAEKARRTLPRPE
ncbi:MAG: hypothetical protein AB7J35_00475 [Dehalococcoidia bacterium]